MSKLINMDMHDVKFFIYEFVQDKEKGKWESYLIFQFTDYIYKWFYIQKQQLCNANKKEEIDWIYENKRRYINQNYTKLKKEFVLHVLFMKSWK